MSSSPGILAEEICSSSLSSRSPRPSVDCGVGLDGAPVVEQQQQQQQRLQQQPSSQSNDSQPPDSHSPEVDPQQQSQPCQLPSTPPLDQQFDIAADDIVSERFDIASDHSALESSSEDLDDEFWWSELKRSASPEGGPPTKRRRPG
jgi:hypothetical protein